VGDFSEGVTWFDRNTAGVYMTDSHADFFIRNQMLILAEQRAHFALTDGAALAKVTINALTPPVVAAATTATK
jgi:HK97 family phage major capsid protein